ncbi:DUF4159 domain-containing protein [Prosthecobacter sp.]|uniref:DUF4159 domain-containing protein n=1 Tax=Prosthecobacter sp. TaxID=1965333 RepID=UPI003783AF17
MNLLKRMLTCLALFLGTPLLSEEAPPLIPMFYHGREVHFPEDPRQFKGWRHFGQNTPLWQVSAELPKDVFTFTRLRYPTRRGGRWTADYPEADLNFSFRLHQLTSVQVNPCPTIIDIEEKQLRGHPFLYVSEPGHMDITTEQARLLRDYMLNGGFILMDDFWGGDEWKGFAPSFKKIWPDRNYVELKPDHPIFHSVFNLTSPPQIHSNVYWQEMNQHGKTNMHNEIRPDSATPRFRAVFDDRGRMVMLICLNNDLGDGWEQEQSDPWYFTHVSEKHAYPLGINIVFYALTH